MSDSDSNTQTAQAPLIAVEATGLRMLIVEDSPRILGFLLESFHSEACYTHIATAATEHDAQRLLQESQRFDIAIIDIQLTQGTGFEVIKAVRASASNAAYLMVLTNHATPFYAQVALGLGADEFLDKSKDFQKIQKLIQARFPQHTKKT